MSRRFAVTVAVAAVAAVTAVAAVAACAKGASTPDVSVAPMTDRVVMGTGAGISLTRSAETVGVSSPVPFPGDDVFRALTTVFQDLKVPVTTTYAEQRALGNQTFKVRRRLGGLPMQSYIDCGGQPGQPNAETFDLELNLMSSVTAGADGGSILTTRLSAIGNDPSHGTGNQMRCSSTGELEARIAKLVKLRLVK